MKRTTIDQWSIVAATEGCQDQDYQSKLVWSHVLPKMVDRMFPSYTGEAGSSCTGMIGNCRARINRLYLKLQKFRTRSAIFFEFQDDERQVVLLLKLL